jgi:hypothetical protein
MSVYKRLKLNQGQIEILNLLYKYRFGSRDLIASNLGINNNTGLYKRLEVLIKHKLVDKRLDKSLKLSGKPMAYWITPVGLKELRDCTQNKNITDAIIKQSYKDKLSSQGFIDHNFNLFKISNMLTNRYSNLKIFTRRDLANYNYFPKNQPDLFLSIRQGDQVKRFFLDLVPETNARRIQYLKLFAYGKYFDAGAWSATGDEEPKLLFVYQNQKSERRFKSFLANIRSKTDMEYIEIYTTSLMELGNLHSSDLVWTDIDDIDEVKGLMDITTSD